MGLQATAIRDMLHAAATVEWDYDTLLKMSGFTPAEIDDSDKILEWQKSAKVYDLLADLTGNEQIGLQMGAQVTLSIVGMVGFLMQVSETLKDAVEVCCKYGHLVCPMIVYRYQASDNLAIVELHQSALWKSTYPRSARIAIDFCMASTVSFIKLLSGKAIYPLGVEVEFSKNALATYTEALHCPVLFGAPQHRLIFRLEDVETPVLTSDKSLYEMFNNILSQKKSMALQTSVIECLRQMLLMQFKGQIPTIEDAAAGLNMTVRTLQRKLAEEQTSFREVAAAVKKELALHLMKNRPGTITEVAEVMGYNDLAAFRRAFKGWTKETPKAVKKQLQAGQLVAQD